MEYGLDPAARYKKRFGGKEREGVAEGGRDGSREKRKKTENDSRPADPASVYSSDARRTGAITEGKGTRKTFDE